MAKVPVLTGASDPRDRTGEAHDGEDLPPCPHSRITARARGVRNHLHLEAEAQVIADAPITCTSKPKRVRPYRTQTTTATPIARRNPSGKATLWTLQLDQVASLGND